MSLQQVDLTAMPAEAEAEARLVMMELARRPFDLAHAPLVRALVVRLAPELAISCFVLNHIVADGISVAILFAELQALYREAMGGAPAALPPLPLQFLDTVQWQNKEFAAGALAGHLDYWKDCAACRRCSRYRPTARARACERTAAAGASCACPRPWWTRCASPRGARA